MVQLLKYQHVRTVNPLEGYRIRMLALARAGYLYTDILPRIYKYRGRIYGSVHRKVVHEICGPNALIHGPLTQISQRARVYGSPIFLPLYLYILDANILLPTGLYRSLVQGTVALGVLKRGI